ncbi:flagellar basal body-associated FliL family protein [Caulobacter sp. NIBR2454]|uniref:flagellar basal body-associated FliL family protein n=1 Tax=Caulobacter sp. NIBR2454 TaxID=3015996 RepID=UPI0022B5F690|nr:flagellar basal body-associated FliL family protein [Caulobacter sp. NIBR2454]
MAKDKGAEPEDAIEEGEEGAEGAKPKKKLPLLIIIIVAAVLVLGVGGAAAFFLLKPKPEGEHAEAKDKKKDEKKKEEKKGEGEEGAKAEGGEGGAIGSIREGPNGVVYYTLPNVIVNMQSADGRPSFLKLKLTLELADAETAETLTPNLPRLQDMFQSFLRELRPEDLSGSQGSYQLRMEIQRRVNLVIAPAEVKAVLIEEMLIN